MLSNPAISLLERPLLTILHICNSRGVNFKLLCVIFRPNEDVKSSSERLIKFKYILSILDPLEIS